MEFKSKDEPDVEVEGDLFGPVIEREIGIAREDDEAYSAKCLIDFETGKLYSAPENFKELQNKTDETEVKFEEQVYQWCKQNGIDTAAIFDDGKGKPAFVLELGKPAGTFLDASPYTWESISHNKLVDVLEHEHLSDEIYLDHSATFIFRTIEGNAGLLQVLDITEKAAKIRYKMVKMEPSKNTDVQVDRIISEESASYLKRLYTAMAKYANDYDDKYPDNIQLLDKYLDAEDLNWLLIHVEYLGKGKTSDDLPTIPLAYDRTPAAEKPTNVLFNNNRVELVTPERLKEFGISKAEIQIEVRLVTASEGPA